MTAEEKDEHKWSAAIAKKLNNAAWRIQNLYWIEDADGKKVKFKLNWAQKLFYEALWYLNVVLKARQVGMSTFSLIMIADRTLFNKNQTCGIVDKGDIAAKRKLAVIAFAYDHLDDPDDPKTAKLGVAIKQAVRLQYNNEHELSFSNGSKVWAGTSLRGGTVQFLLISELGYIAFNFPKKAEEIKAGAFNTVHAGNIVVIESTHEGGKYGLNYDMIKVAQAAPDKLTEMDWKFHFFSWQGHPSYVLPLNGPLDLPVELLEYFAKLKKEDKINLSDEQKNFYWKKWVVQGDAMWKEFCSTAEEAVNAVIKGAIYGKLISKLRRQKRIVDFNHDPMLPIYAFWDIGYSDYTSIWLIQLVGRDICALRYYCRNEESAPHYVDKCMEWEREYGKPIAWHFLPHDADKAEGMGSGKSTKQFLIEAGMDANRITVVPRTPDLWQGINALRGLIGRFYIHLTNCSKSWKSSAGDNMPSGLECLEGYHTKEEKVGGMVYDTPVHDATSHGCDSLRTFAEAFTQGLLKGVSELARASRVPGSKPKVLRGAGEHSYPTRSKSKPNVKR